MAPRLLDKKTINTTLATQQKKQIDQGVAIAKKVDAVRSSLAEEEFKLEQFRTESIAKVQREIDTEIAKRDALIEGNKILHEERIRLSAPIDLTRAWEEVKEEQQHNSSWEERLSEQSIELLAKEEDVRQAKQIISRRVKESDAREELTSRLLEDAEQKHLQAENALTKAERSAQETLRNAQEAENHVRIREEDALAREKELTKREREVAAHELDLSNREKKLKSRQELFLKAQAYIKSKK